MDMEEFKFGFYRRKSTDEKRKQQLSLETQDSWKNREVKNFGYSIVKEYTESETATKVVMRPEFYRMIEDIHTGAINAILTYEIDRLARNFTENSIIQTLSQEGKIKIIHTNTGIFYPNDILHLGMKALFSVYESHQMKKKMKDGTKSALEKGMYMGGIRYGYDVVNKKLQINEEEASHIRKIFELRDEGLTLEQIRKTVNALGFRHRDRFLKSGAKLEGNVLKKSTIERIVQNPLYYGMISYAGELYQGIHEPIVSKELFDRVNGNKKSIPRRSDTSPLKGKVFFEGEPLTVSLVKNKFIYFHKHSRKAGEKLWLNQNEILDFFDKNISLYKMPKKYKKECLGYVNESYKEKKEDIETIRKNLKRKHSDIEHEIDALISMRTRGELSQEEFLPRKNKLINDLKDIEEQNKKLTEEKDHAITGASELVELLINIDQYWIKWDIAMKIYWISEVVEEIKVDLVELENGKEKRLYIEENPIMQAFRKTNSEEWWTLRVRRHNLYNVILQNSRELEKMGRVFEKILSQN